MGPDDDTPPLGTEIPDDVPTQPALATLTCPACLGQGRSLRTTGAAYRMQACETCEGAGLVSKEAYEAWIAKRRKAP